MRTTTIVTMGGSALLATAVLAVTFATPPDGASATDHVLQSSASTGPSSTPARAGSPTVVLTSVAAGSTSTKPAPLPLTAEQQALIDSYLAVHPGRAQRLAATAARWKAFADANPALAAELEKVAAMAPAERRQELTAWFAAHPDQKAAFTEWVKTTHDERAERRQERRDRRQDRRDRRRERRESRNGGTGTPAPAPSTSSSALTTSSQV
jgi:hypothetical protein